MRRQQIETWIDSLKSSFGPAKAPVDEHMLESAWKADDIGEMVYIVKKVIGIRLNLNLALVNSGNGSIPAWVRRPEPMPLIGTPKYLATTATIFLRKSFIKTCGFDGMVLVISHEMSHILLDSLWHNLRSMEEVVDLTAMYLGFRDFYVTGCTRYFLMEQEQKLAEYQRGYLTKKEISHAADYMTYG